MKADLPLFQVDELGMLLAQIATLTKRADEIKESMKDTATAGGPSAFDGTMFKATVIEQNRRVTDWKAIAKQFNIPEQAIIDNTSVTAVFSVKVTAR